MAIVHIEASKIMEAVKGSRGSYIEDGLGYRKDSPPYSRIMITEALADAMLKTVGWTTKRDYSDTALPLLCNKEYVCVERAGEGRESGMQREQALFVYDHDFTYWLYAVGS